MSELTPQAVRDIAERAAIAASRQTVETLFLHMGIDVNDKTSLKELKENLAFLHELRESKETISKAAKVAAASAIVTALFGIIWLGVKAAMSGWLTLPIK